MLVNLAGNVPQDLLLPFRQHDSGQSNLHENEKPGSIESIHAAGLGWNYLRLGFFATFFTAFFAGFAAAPCFASLRFFAYSRIFFSNCTS